MQVKEHRITVREVVAGYKNDSEEGVVGYGGKLDIRPKYQREFVYKEEQRNAVLNSILKGYPLNVMYWAKTGNDTFEVLDGQQRTLSICQYVDNQFAIDGDKYFRNQPEDIRNKILNYELFVYVCDGEESEKLDWFKIVNIAGERLTDQELRNAVYAGSWTADAKKYFSKTGGPANQLAGDYLKGASIRQEYLETALSWIASKEKTTIEEYMGRHQDDYTAQELWSYFRTVIEWVKSVFPKVYKEMKGLPWGLYYNAHGHRKDLDPVKLGKKVKSLMGDDDVTRKSGIFEYLLTGDEKCLSIRAFSRRDKLSAYKRQNEKCNICGKKFKIEEMHGDHIKPWSKGGKTVPENCQLLCSDCNLKKAAD